jgi:ATP sulfurylase
MELLADPDYCHGQIRAYEERTRSKVSKLDENYKKHIAKGWGSIIDFESLFSEDLAHEIMRKLAVSLLFLR